MEKIVLLLAGIICLISCKKGIQDQTQSTKLNSNPSLRLADFKDTKKSFFKSLGQLIMKTAKNDVEFKRLVYKECSVGNETYGDYYVTVPHLLEINTFKMFWNSSEVNYITHLVDSIKTDDPNQSSDPIVFIPVVQDRNLDSLIQYCPSGTPQGVFTFEYNKSSMVCPAYTLNNNDLLDQRDSINEQKAWSNDVWVFGQEEIVSPENMTPNDTEGTQDTQSDPRNSGDAEYGGIIQVTDMGALEPWVSGKFEFKYFVFSASGASIKEKGFGKKKRKNFKDEAWYYMTDFIANWNTSTIGNWMVEAWIEEDGGDETQTTTFSVPAPCPGCPATNISFTSKKSDDVMGRSMVQFTDPLATIYGITAANFKRSSP